MLHPSAEQVVENPAPVTYDQIQEMVARAMGSVGTDLGRIKGNPFVRKIREAHMPEHIKLPSFDTYNGTTDPQDHLCHVNSLLDLHSLNDDLRCRILPTTFRENARIWHNDLRAESISSYEDYCRLFLNTFVGSTAWQKPVSELSNIKQEQDESLKDFLNRFNTAALQVENKTEESYIQAFVYEIRSGYLNRKLNEKYPRTMHEMLTQVYKQIKGEESDWSKRT